MATPPAGAEAGAAALLAREARSERARLIPSVLIGLGIAACGVAQALLIARLLATLLGRADAGWSDLAAAGVLALLMAALGIAQERAQLAAAEGAKARLRIAAFSRLLAAGPADERAVGEKSTLVVERIEALEGYFSRWLPAAALAVLAPMLVAGEPEGLLLEEVPPKVTVTFHQVHLSYDPSRPPALDGLSFRVLPGETLLLTGASGSGKTSVLRILMGFRSPDGGRVAINGHDVTRLRPAELRRLSSYVGQRAHIFRGTIRENIRFARPEADDAAVEAAARAAQVSEFAAGLPEGLDTLVGEGGFGLSGGQAQRVAVARAFLRDTPLVLLDEPTAHLDPGTEAVVLDAIRRLCVGRTAIVATHARAARSQFGQVLELAAGRAVADRMAGN